MSRDRGVNAVDIPAKERHDAGPLLLPRALPAPRSLYFIGGLLLVATLGLIVWLAVAPDTSPATAPIPAAQATPTVSECERVLLANLAIAQRASEAFWRHDRATGEALIGQSIAIPNGCPS